MRPKPSEQPGGAMDEALPRGSGEAMPNAKQGASGKASALLDRLRVERNPARLTAPREEFARRSAGVNLERRLLSLPLSHPRRQLRPRARV